MQIFRNPILFLLIVTSILFSCKGKKNSIPESSIPNGFVTLHGDSFRIGKDYFYPVTVNFLFSLQANSNDVWPVSSESYYEGNKFRYATKEDCLRELAHEMELIREMGFNSVRFVGAGEVKPHGDTNDLLSIHAYIGNDGDTTLVLSDSTAYANYLQAIDELIDIAGEAGLKVILLTRVTPGSNSTELHLQKMATHLKENASLMAFDLFNEPLYFDPEERVKSDIYAITKKWDDIVNRYAPYHLTTIGLTGMREVFEWDPNILQVDFISFHPYEYEHEQVRNEIYWYHTYVSKPWIIGETAIPADGDSVKYDVQAAFAAKTLKQSWDCYASGYTWWQYKDVKWAKFHSSYMGVLNREGTTVTTKGNKVAGTVKPVADKFKKFSTTDIRDSCACFSNYYNYSESQGYRLKGKIVDATETPVEGAVIMAWSEDWLQLNHTVTKKDGSFELKADFQLHHWMASATNHSMVKAYVHPEKNASYINGVSFVDLGSIFIKRLQFAD